MDCFAALIQLATSVELLCSIEAQLMPYISSIYTDVVVIFINRELDEVVAARQLL